MAKKTGDDGARQEPLAIIEPIDIQEEMERSFLEYSMSVIVSRALPDVRDGLKPVHRRILYGMHTGGLRPERPHRKCGRVVGDVMGQYHPHGDQAIYDALARMTQPFSLRYPLIDGHGNFGSPDPNDRPAAMRYCVVEGSRVRTPFGSPRIETLAGDVPAPNSTTDVEAKVYDHRGDVVGASKLFHSGFQPTLRVRTREGYELEGTHNHPVLCVVAVDGAPRLEWRLLSEVAPGTRVVLDRHPELSAPEDLTDHERHLAVLLGAFVAEGFISERRAGFNNTDPELFHRVVEAYDTVVGGRRTVSKRVIASGSTLYELDVHDRLSLWSSELAEELGDAKSAEKQIPEIVWGSSAAFKQAFLQALFEGDGSSSLLGRNTIQVSYSTRSEQLARDVQRLLLEFGVVSRRSLSERGEWKVYLGNRRDARLFANNVGFLGRKQQRLLNQLATIPLTSRALSSDHAPFVAGYVRRASGARGDDRAWLEKHNLDRVERWERDADEILSRIPSREVQRTVLGVMNPNWYFAEVTVVEDAGVQPVYSIRVDTDEHAFISDGFVSHNTECRLDDLATLMLQGIDEDTVDFADTYDGENSEPVVLPARFPNLLVNGGGGIAVGMATNVPPHNLTEVIDATTHLIDNPDASIQDLMQFVTGPDFPTGGRILGRQGILDAYTTGRGSVKMRAVAEIEEGPRNTMRIVVSEVPYQTSVEQIGQKIEELVADRKLDGIRDIRNESSGVTQRLVVELKRDANPQVVLNNLFKQTPMQSNFACLMLALVDGAPKVLNLREILEAYVAHQVEVITRRSEYRLQKAKDRLHIVEGLLKALDMIDQVIEVIRGSDDADGARQALMAQPFEFSEIQANHILDMPLRRLTGLERQKLVDESEELHATIKDLEAILGDDKKLRAVIKDELGEVKEKFGDERRTPIEHDPGEIDVLDLIEDEEVIVVLSENGYAKTVKADAFRAQGRGGRGVSGAKLRDDDYVAHLLTTSAHAYLLFFSNIGKVYRLRAHEIPMKERTARGTALVNLVQMGQDEKIQAVIDTREYEEGVNLFFSTRQGKVKKTKMGEYDSSYARSGIIAIKLNEGDELVKVVQTDGDDEVFMVSEQGMTIRFSEEEVRPMGRSAAGVQGMKLKAGDAVVSCDVARDDTDILILTSSGHGKRTKLERFNAQHRGGQGVRGMKITQKRGKVVSAFMVGLEDEILVFSSAGNVIRMQAKEISSQGRTATGVRVARVGADDTVVAVAPVLDQDDE